VVRENLICPENEPSSVGRPVRKSDRPQIMPRPGSSTSRCRRAVPGTGALGQDILDLPVRYTDALEMTEEVH
jgi:hypothetical protein